MEKITAITNLVVTIVVFATLAGLAIPDEIDVAKTTIEAIGEEVEPNSMAQKTIQNLLIVLGILGVFLPVIIFLNPVSDLIKSFMGAER